MRLPIPRPVRPTEPDTTVKGVLKKLFCHGSVLVLLAQIWAIACLWLYIHWGKHRNPTLLQTLAVVLPYLALLVWGGLYLGWWFDYWKTRAFNRVFGVNAISNLELFLDRDKE